MSGTFVWVELQVWGSDEMSREWEEETHKRRSRKLQVIEWQAIFFIFQDAPCFRSSSVKKEPIETAYVMLTVI